MTHHNVVARDAWIAARQQLLIKEKEFTKLRDELSQQRRELPWERVDKNYLFEGPDGRETLAQLFAGRSQLVVYHFMFGPDWQAGCPHCSFWADNFDGIIEHLNQRDTTMVVASRASPAKLAAYKKRMGWHFKWVSSGATDFNFDFQASFTDQAVAEKSAFYNFKRQDPGMSDREGLSVFFKDADGSVFHTYSTYARGIDIINTAYNTLDLTPKGRDEGDRGPLGPPPRRIRGETSRIRLERVLINARPRQQMSGVVHKADHWQVFSAPASRPALQRIVSVCRAAAHRRTRSGS